MLYYDRFGLPLGTLLLTLHHVINRRASVNRKRIIIIKHCLQFVCTDVLFQLPKLFFINLFQNGSNNEYLWPGYGDNIRIFEWIIRRISSPTVDSVINTPIGFVPMQESMNLKVNRQFIYFFSILNFYSGVLFYIM